MPTSLSNLIDILSDGLYDNRCTDCESYLHCMSIKDDQLIFRCFKCKKSYMKNFNRDLTNRFANTYKHCNTDIN